MRFLRHRETAAADRAHRETTESGRPHREPSAAPIIVTVIALGLAFIVMTLIWQAAT